AVPRSREGDSRPVRRPDRVAVHCSAGMLSQVPTVRALCIGDEDVGEVLDWRWSFQRAAECDPLAVRRPGGSQVEVGIAYAEAAPAGTRRTDTALETAGI